METTCENRVFVDSPLLSKVALFNRFANNHIQNQAINPFSNDGKVGEIPKPKISKEEYGRPAKGSLSEARALSATKHVYKEMLELCEVINANGEPLFTSKEKQNDLRKVISFGELFNLYTVISNKLVGILLRTRKYKIVDFEGECLFQGRDDYVPVILLKPIEEVRRICKDKIKAAEAVLEGNTESNHQQQPE